MTGRLFRLTECLRGILNDENNQFFNTPNTAGDTKAIKDLLKQLGGRFNSHLSCGAGWVFSKKAEGKLRAALVGA